MLRKRGSSAYAILVVAAALLLTACGGSSKGAIVPVAFGQNGQCYYVHSASEVKALKQAKDCPESSQPAAMPISWLILYFAFYNSAYYRQTFVPSSSSSSYSGYMSGVQNADKEQIEEDAPSAQYLDDGKDVTGDQAGVDADGTSIGDDSGSDYTYAGDSDSDSGDGDGTTVDSGGDSDSVDNDNSGFTGDDGSDSIGDDGGGFSGGDDG